MLSRQGVALFERIKRCGLVGRSVSLELELRFRKPMLSPESVFLPVAQNAVLYYCSKVRLQAALLPAMMRMD